MSLGLVKKMYVKYVSEHEALDSFRHIPDINLILLDIGYLIVTTLLLGYLI